MSDTAPSRGALPASAVEFGQRLRTLRLDSLRDLAARQHEVPGCPVLFRSQLSRDENGDLLPPLKHAEYLDELYNADGWTPLALHSLWQPSWEPWSREHMASPPIGTPHHWPAAYAGTVWIAVKPLPASISRTHLLTLDWGSWRARLSVPLAAAGVLLVTGTAVDDANVTVTCNLTSYIPVFSLSGA